MKKLCSVLALSLAFGWASAQVAAKRVLVFSKTTEFRHASIGVGKVALIKMGTQNGFAVDTTEDATQFTDANLQKYNAVVFLSTTGDILNPKQQESFEHYIQAGGGFVGIHAATDTEYGWPWYNRLVGAQFASHPASPNVQNGEAYAVDNTHPSMFGFPERWKTKDEFYDFKNYNVHVKNLVKIDEKTYKEGKMGSDHPMAWYHDFDGGKAFYTAFGHTDEAYADPVFLNHVLGGLKSVMAAQLTPAKARPEANRFTKTVLVDNLNEPTELAILPTGKVLFGERRGALKVYNPVTKKTKVVAQIPVYNTFEYGLMGVNIDPKFAQNKWVYLYYSPVGDSTFHDQYLSRFVYDDAKDTLVMQSEKVMLKVYVKRNDCCHTGGSIDWDSKGNLYLSTGDDTNPFASEGFSPIDGRAKRSGWDARHTSSNSNDLRGKILRIRPTADGGYAIPEGNLFATGTKNARPEIYVMGNRNPYRISVDQRNNYLYWGEVGPDAGEDNLAKYGSAGHCEFNQAREAGYYGWPLFVADNKPYRAFNFADSTSGDFFVANKPINDSPHNTGLRELPPAQKAFIWYPYNDSKEFPQLGKGGRNPMAGPVYYADDHQGATKFPAYYDGKFFAYEWMRDFIMTVEMNAKGDYVNMERFLPDVKFENPMDMAFDKNGTLFVLEYGQNWFAQNPEATLSRIDFNPGNRKPVAELAVDKKVGASPLTVQFSSAKSMDSDGDALKYEWTFGKGLPKSTQPNPKFTFTKKGVYNAVLKVTDAKGNQSLTSQTIKVGNAEPNVQVAVKGNQTFYWNNQKVDYEVKVTDKEDGTLAKGIDPEDVVMTIDYLDGFDKTVIAQGHQANTGVSTGKRLIELSDCKSCHQNEQKSIGPAYREVAKKYKNGFMAVENLTRKIIKGGGGVWGEQAMSAHPQITEDEAKDMVKYILSLDDQKAAKKEPLKGNYALNDQKKEGTYIFNASYTDKGSGAIGPNTINRTVVLRSAKLKANTFDGGKDYMKYKLPTGAEVVVAITDKSYVLFRDIDLSTVLGVTFQAFSSAGVTCGGKMEIRTGSPTGTLIGEATIPNGSMKPLSTSIKSQEGKHDVYFVFTNPENKGKPLFAVDWIEFKNQGM